ncbi:MAG: DUF5655 domain-containing protein [Gammaproteobacteria bacterium]|nr:DUF5655 domain-containing protein [Gammaproteobacteria bacterium]
MPLFRISEKRLLRVEKESFRLERELQTLIESNLEEVFRCRFVASEFRTGEQHAGRIDSLALSEEDNPVIIEYKNTESSKLINQSLFYLHWILDHKGDFEIAVQKYLGQEARVDWSETRVICIAPNYAKYDLHAAQVMGANSTEVGWTIELWKYHLFADGRLYLEEVHRNRKSTLSTTRATGRKSLEIPTFERHLEGRSEQIQKLMRHISEFVAELDSAIEEVPKKKYVAYKGAQNILCMQAQKESINLFVKLRPSDIEEPPKSFEDVSGKGHQATGDVKFRISSQEEFGEVKKYIEMAYNKIGG